MRRMNLWTVIFVILVVPSMVFAGSVHKFGVAKASAGDENLVVVPLEVTNQDNLAAIDISLKYSEGVTLKEVDFAGTRVEYFDLKVAGIDHASRTVVIGLLPQMTPEPKPDLKAGSGTVANLVFEVDDPTVENVTLEAITLEKPRHTLTFVYHDNGGIRVEKPEFDNVTLSLAGLSTGLSQPHAFELSQNYPNPFNPSTTVRFYLPQSSQVNLTVYNVLGQKVTTMEDGMLDKGWQEREWDGSAHASGVYFYRLVTSDNTSTKKMMLLK